MQKKEVHEKFLRPMHDNVLLIQYTHKDTNGGEGLYLPETLQEKQMKTTCVVSALGDDVKSPHLKEGKFVIIPSRTGKWVEWEGSKYVLVNEKDILCIIEGIYGYNDPEDLKKFGIELEE